MQPLERFLTHRDYVGQIPTELSDTNCNTKVDSVFNAFAWFPMLVWFAFFLFHLWITLQSLNDIYYLCIISLI